MNASNDSQQPGPQDAPAPTTEGASVAKRATAADAGSGRARPDRPSVRSPNAPPVLVKEAAPFMVRLSQLAWVLSFAVGGVAVVFFFVIRSDQLPLMADVVRGVDPTRSDETYEIAADIIFWSAFAIMVAILFVQITLLVSFMSRRKGIRWWQLMTLLVQALLFPLALQLVAAGEQGMPLSQLLAIQCGLVILALLFSTFPAAIAWTARQHDVRRGSPGSGPEL